MDNLNIVSEIKNLLSEGGSIEENVPMRDYTTFRIGGPADIMVEAASETEMSSVLSFLNNENIPYFVLGNGSNVLVGDDGYRGVILRCKADGFGNISINDQTLVAGASLLLSNVAKAAAEESLSGMEFASGIPGTLGGAVFMNAGAYDGEMAQIVQSVKAVMPDGTIVTFKPEEMNFGYRNSVFQENNAVIIEVELFLKKGNKAEILELMKDLNARRIEKQPLNFPSAGSTFKRPEGYYAAKLIQDAGCKGFAIGGARVSPKHAGFIINENRATADDVLELIDLVQCQVRDKFGVELEPEVKIIGE